MQIDTDAYYLLQNHRSGLVADVPDGSTANGTELVQWERNGSAAQQFRFVPSGEGYYRIVNRGSGKAVDVWEWNTQGGAEIRQYDDLGGANQQWMPVDRAGGVQFVNRHSGMALEVWAWSTRQGDRLSQWDPHGGASQIWDLIEVDGGTPDPTDPPEPTDPPDGSAIHAAPGGSSGASGTASNPTTLTSAIDRVDPGGTIYLRGGTYRLSQTVAIDGNGGSSSGRTLLSAYPGETPVLNFSAQSENSSNRGLSLNVSYWHLRGLVVEHAGDNGIAIGGSHNIVEGTTTRFNHDTGLQISRASSSTPRSQWPAHNLVVSSVSHDNADSDGEDADGFAAKLTSGEGNVFRNTVAHHNIDDGWDLYTKTETGAIGAVTIEDSLAYGNGTLSDGTQNASGDRNGLKLGDEDISVRHVIRNNVAYGNGKHGFTYNRNPGPMMVTGNVSLGNEVRNFNFDGGSSYFRDNTSCDGGSTDRYYGDADGSNQFWNGSNGSRCSSYGGGLDWYFTGDGRLVVTIGGNRV
ncbi:RICIN domain-containing protein [Nocardiopsis sp. CNT312]|uniref:RICIN domain-containing protein n=1 Tax=Nocardiopsis sp. CNT312 TaxID=1137268 RepID=UPI001E54199B|nr:RICIN domain-containing protein [Nocardiopsis sp. CNT312]